MRFGLNRALTNPSWNAKKTSHENVLIKTREITQQLLSLIKSEKCTNVYTTKFTSFKIKWGLIQKLLVQENAKQIFYNDMSSPVGNICFSLNDMQIRNL